MRFFFLRVTNFNTSPMPPFSKFLSGTFNSEQKLSVKNRSTGPVKNRSTGCSPAGQPAMILKFTGRAEKILTGSISVSHTRIVQLFLTYHDKKYSSLLKNIKSRGKQENFQSKIKDLVNIAQVRFLI